MAKSLTDIEQIDKRIKKFKNKKNNNADKESKRFVYAYQIGSRIAAELVSGVLVGAGLGYVLDKVLSSAPLLLIIFLILGGVAGFLNVYRFVKKEDNKKEIK